MEIPSKNFQRVLMAKTRPQYDFHVAFWGEGVGWRLVQTVDSSKPDD